MLLRQMKHLDSLRSLLAMGKHWTSQDHNQSQHRVFDRRNHFGLPEVN